ncbi:MAG: glycosyltransferase family 4 protein [Pyrinomonadaceae bacterium]
MKVLGLASYPVEAAATRYRLQQFVAPLAARGITLEVRPFLDSRLFAALYRRQELPRTIIKLLYSGLRRFGDVLAAREFDAVFVQREAMLLGPPVIEWLAMKVGGCPMVLDLDDATYVAYTSPTYGRLGSSLKWFSKTNDLIRWAKIVTCGNPLIAEYVESKGTRAVVIPTVVDTDLFCPRPQASAAHDVPVLGWIGTHSTFAYLESIFPVLQQLARSFPFRLRIVGAGRGKIDLPGIEVENLEWSLPREVQDFQSLDIGLYPIIASEWAAGKSGFKAIQYMAVGVPYVATPIGASADIDEHGTTHFNASSPEQWFEALTRLLSNADLRKRMGEAGRRHALQHYTVEQQAEKLARALREAASV